MIDKAVVENLVREFRCHATRFDMLYEGHLVDELRFKVGDLVQANIGEFVNGKIVKLWDDGNAYRIELEDGNRTNVFAPIDNSAYVRTRE